MKYTCGDMLMDRCDAPSQLSTHQIRSEHMLQLPDSLDARTGRVSPFQSRAYTHLHHRAQKGTIESKSAMLSVFASPSSFVISFRKRDATLKATEAFCVLSVAANSLPLKNVVRAISLLCALESRDQMSSA